MVYLYLCRHCVCGETVRCNVAAITYNKNNSVKTLRNHFTDDVINWLKSNGLKFREVDINLEGNLMVLYNDTYCLKLYDRLGHGFGVNINVTDGYDESIYENDAFTLYWAFKYLEINETASFGSRTEKQYLENLPNLINDIKIIIPKLNKMDPLEWKRMKEWITKEALKNFGLSTS
jgi:hypothetical protein